MPDPEPWITRFSPFPRVQLIDLDAARGRGENTALMQMVCGRLPCRVGGGIRSIARAEAVLGAGAHAVIVSSSLFRDGAVDVAFAASLADAIGAERVIAAVDSRGGHVAIHGWKTILPITAVEAVRALEPYCHEFLYTHVDTEGMMQGTDMAAIRAVRAATGRRLTAAGGITTWEDIDRLDAECDRRRRRHGHLHWPAAADAGIEGRKAARLADRRQKTESPPLRYPTLRLR